MKLMEMFRNPEFGSIRIVEENGNYLFCGIDAAKALGYVKPRNALNAHCRGALKRGFLTNGGRQELTFISEGDLYRLIVHSKLPSAERFEKWIFDDVLPSIRRHGAYLTDNKLIEIAASPEALMKLYSDLTAERNEKAALRAENIMLKEKASYFDLFIESGHCTDLRITAKELEVPERRFICFLLGRKFIYRSPSGCMLPYSKAENKRFFCVKDYCRNGCFGAYTLVTPEGKKYFSKLRDLILVTV